MSFCSLLLFLLFCTLGAPAWSAPASSVPPATLAADIAAARRRVPEFEFIRQEASRLGLRAWLFGGTAASFAHYVKWDDLRKQGDHRFHDDFFDYDYTSIFRSAQDADIVVDGPAEKAKELQAALAAHYGHLQGAKTDWEVRPLREPIGTKQALLNDPEFSKQHTDSSSTGMIELTDGKGEPVVRDLRAWEDPNANFLHDVSSGKLRYYHSPLHAETERFKAGKNPEIFSVLRALIKSAQFDLEVSPEEKERFRKVIAAFDPEKDLPTDYAKQWIEKNGKKLVQSALDIEKSLALADELGLRQKLIDIRKDVGEVDSLAWWMDRKALPTRPLGQGPGLTAAELAKEKNVPELVLAHETKDLKAFEAIARSPVGAPNVLSSREKAVGEMAVHGEGFYLREGREGARGTGLTLRFTLDPRAREGSDFKRVADDYYVVTNRAALRLRPESLHWTPLEYFRFLADEMTISDSDRGLFELLQRRIGNRMSDIPPAEIAEIEQIVRGKLAKGEASYPLMKAWFRLPQSTKVGRDIFDDFAGRKLHTLFLDRELGALPHWAKDPALAPLKQEAAVLTKRFQAGSLSSLSDAERKELRFLIADGKDWKETARTLEKGLAHDATDRELVGTILKKFDDALAALLPGKQIPRELSWALLSEVFAKPSSAAWRPELQQFLKLMRAVDFDLFANLVNEKGLVPNLDLYRAKVHPFLGHPEGRHLGSLERAINRIERDTTGKRCKGFFADVARFAGQNIVYVAPAGFGGTIGAAKAYAWMSDSSRAHTVEDARDAVIELGRQQAGEAYESTTKEEFLQRSRPDLKRVQAALDKAGCENPRSSDCNFFNTVGSHPDQLYAEQLRKSTEASLPKFRRLGGTPEEEKHLLDSMEWRPSWMRRF